MHNSLKDKVQQLGPRLSTATLLFHEAAAARLGLNATDMKCLTFISNATGPITAGNLTAFTGLTTGAITQLIDRLEKTKLIKRTRDNMDGRKVILQINAGAYKKISQQYLPLRKAVEKMVAGYTEAELKIIAHFVEQSIEVMESQAKELRSRGHLK